MRAAEQAHPARLRKARRRRGRGRRSAARLIAAQVGYQLRVAARSPLGAFATLVVPLMVLLAVNLLYRGTHLGARGGIAYAQFFTPAMVAFAVINVCYMSLISHTTLVRDEGILKRVRGTPLPPWVYMAGSLGSAGVISLLSVIAVLAVGAGVYGFQMVWSAVPVALLTVAVGMFCFSALGLAVTVLVPSADSAFAIAWGTMLPLCFISDVFMPIDGAPSWLRAVASVFPVRPFADSLEHMFNPVVGSTALPWVHLAVMAGWGASAAAFALARFRWEPAARSSRRSGGATGHGRTAFAVERLRELLEERVGRHEPEPEKPEKHEPTSRGGRSRSAGSDSA